MKKYPACLSFNTSKQAVIIVTYFLLVMIFCGPVSASSKENVLSFDSFIKNSIQNNPAFEQAYQTYITSQYTVQRIQKKSDPVVSLGTRLDQIDNPAAASYELDIQKQVPGTGTAVHIVHTKGDLGSNSDLMVPSPVSEISNISQSSTRIFLKQSLLRNGFGFQERKNLDIAELAVKTAELELLENWEAHIAALYVDYLNWQAAYDRVLILTEAIRRIRDLEAIIVAKRKAGLVAESERLRILATKIDYQSRLTEAKTSFDNMTLTIRQSQGAKMSLPNQIVVPVLEKIPDVLASLSSLPKGSTGESLRKIRILQTEKEQFCHQSEIAKDNQLPSLDFTIGTAFLETSAHAGIMAKLQGSFVIGGGESKIEAAKALSQLKSVDMQLTQTIADLNTNLLKSINGLHRDREIFQMMITKNKMLLTKLVMDLKSYALNRLDIFFLLNAYTALLDQEISMVDTKYAIRKEWVRYMDDNDILLIRHTELFQLIFNHSVS